MIHRAHTDLPGPIDVVIVATAAAHRLTVLTATGDFTCLAGVTGQRVDVIASPRSSTA